MSIRTCVATIKGVSPYSPSQFIAEEKARSESWAAFETRIWRQKAHTTPDGRVSIPFMAFKKALDAAASLTPRKIKGRGQQTYTKQMQVGVILDQPLDLPLRLDEMRCETFLCSATGDARGVGGRVPRTFPMIDRWGGDLHFKIINESIPQDVFETYLREAGLFIGIGRFRPENRGVNGRFAVETCRWEGI